jgi:hypothetical protein
MHLAHGNGSNNGPPFKVLLARVIDPYMWSFFKMLLACGSGSNIVLPFKELFVRGNFSNLCSLIKMHIARGSGCFMIGRVGLC